MASQTSVCLQLLIKTTQSSEKTNISPKNLRTLSKASDTVRSLFFTRFTRQRLAFSQDRSLKQDDLKARTDSVKVFGKQQPDWLANPFQALSISFQSQVRASKIRLESLRITMRKRVPGFANLVHSTATKDRSRLSVKTTLLWWAMFCAQSRTALSSTITT